MNEQHLELWPGLLEAAIKLCNGDANMRHNEKMVMIEEDSKDLFNESLMHAFCSRI